MQTVGSEKSVKNGLALAAAGLIMIAGLSIQNGCMSVKPVGQDSARRLTPEETAGRHLPRKGRFSEAVHRGFGTRRADCEVTGRSRSP